MGLPLRKPSGDPSDGETEVKSNRMRVQIPLDEPERIGLEGRTGSEVVRFWGCVS